jgi:hypothetical protein
MGILAAAAGALALILQGLRNAPEGYEDELGFHLKQTKRTPGGRVYRRGKPTGKSELPGVRKPREAHS